MPTLSNFTRPTDPIDSDQLCSDIAAAVGSSVTCVITPTDIQVTGNSISESNRSAIQTVLNNYYYKYLQTPGAALSDNPDMSAKRHNMAVSEYATYMNAANIMNSTGKAAPPTGVAYGFYPILRKATTNASGVATIYLTDSNTAGGAALFTTILEEGIVAMPVGPNNYQVTAVTVSADKKSMTVALNQISTILGLLTFSATSGAGIEVRAAVWGK